MITFMLCFAGYWSAVFFMVNVFVLPAFFAQGRKFGYIGVGCCFLWLGSSFVCLSTAVKLYDHKYATNLMQPILQEAMRRN